MYACLITNYVFDTTTKITEPIDLVVALLDWSNATKWHFWLAKRNIATPTKSVNKIKPVNPEFTFRRSTICDRYEKVWGKNVGIWHVANNTNGGCSPLFSYAKCVAKKKQPCAIFVRWPNCRKTDSMEWVCKYDAKSI